MSEPVAHLAQCRIGLGDHPCHAVEPVGHGRPDPQLDRDTCGPSAFGEGFGVAPAAVHLARVQQHGWDPGEIGVEH